MERIISGDKAKMPMTERFYSVNGQMMGYESGGVKKDFLTDHLGSITAEIDQTQTRTYDTRYSAYGRNNWSTGTGCGFGWVGSYGYRETGLAQMSHYVRARHYSYITGNWSTVDPLWPSESAYGYVNGRATTDMDPTGNQAGNSAGDFAGSFPNGLRLPRIGNVNCAQCAYDIFKNWFPLPQHNCNSCYAHCMACCVMTKQSNANCAQSWQDAQNSRDEGKGKDQDRMIRYRNKYCGYGTVIGGLPTKPPHTDFGHCNAGCHAKCPYPYPPIRKECVGLIKPGGVPTFPPDFPHLPNCDKTPPHVRHLCDWIPF
ncbi:MAG: hypothetical protein EBQ88_00040 [Betaproteobacteria bacterium]|jgi:RHS repeat-associated protein|nr:hypothetical protein [Betaproteobacteria bacterium]